MQGDSPRGLAKIGARAITSRSIIVGIAGVDASGSVIMALRDKGRGVRGVRGQSAGRSVIVVVAGRCGDCKILMPKSPAVG